MKVNEEKLIRWFTIYKKKILFSLRSSNPNTYPVFIQGCGRSGTTMLLNILFRDSRIETFGENDPKIAENFLLKWENIPRTIKHSKAQVVAMKPILNSFEAKIILEKYDNAKTIWMLRDYRDMVKSSILKFGYDTANYLKNIVINGEGENWISFAIPSDTLAILSTLDYGQFSYNDWMALIWWSVNRTVITNKITDNNRFFLINYEDLVENPDYWLEKLYKHINLKYKKEFSKFIHGASVGKGSSIKLHPVVDHMCNELKEALFKIDK